MVAPLTIAVTGIAIIPKRAERALLDVEISATGFSRAFISAEVQLSCRRLEDILRKISPANDSQLARESATIAHWSMTSLKTTSHLPTDQYGTVLKNAQRVYSTSVSFDIRIRDFSKLGTFASQVSTLPYTLIHSVRWALRCCIDYWHLWLLLYFRGQRLLKGLIRDGVEFYVSIAAVSSNQI
ncbi:hypothetical protein D6D19_06512 [Aureobasidium pullulans]|uniref:Uncharacterized protein n=1 Tax=Aureobasidium pullulans TaxID=5580 RepID=A0A4S9A0W9_AURPU|nr:hypothetical protein D6D19_06512 [Aureobasidium pullulans]